ncbi:cysteine proteinase [Aulographum hederae CBS 113979]|uniref:ubiquitinyl hydrolase 1 n=1 Tax=Aulographum hederae CBS 113979 TaxID=1176131 RepID=A0A6G1HAI0_9PEZI|nr:cysteine proteinase [Aulographum hederae CBS 113979]
MPQSGSFHWISSTSSSITPPAVATASDEAPRPFCVALSSVATTTGGASPSAPSISTSVGSSTSSHSSASISTPAFPVSFPSPSSSSSLFNAANKLPSIFAFESSQFLLLSLTLLSLSSDFSTFFSVLSRTMSARSMPLSWRSRFWRESGFFFCDLVMPLPARGKSTVEVGAGMFLRDLSVLREGEVSRRAAREWREGAGGGLVCYVSRHVPLAFGVAVAANINTNCIFSLSGQTPLNVCTRHALHPEQLYSITHAFVSLPNAHPHSQKSPPARDLEHDLLLSKAMNSSENTHESPSIDGPFGSRYDSSRAVATAVTTVVSILGALLLIYKRRIFEGFSVYNMQQQILSVFGRSSFLHPLLPKGNLVKQLFTISYQGLDSATSAMGFRMKHSARDAPPGLANPRVSCYHNSIIQGMASLDSLRMYFKDNLETYPAPALANSTHHTLGYMLEQLNNPENTGLTLWTPQKLMNMGDIDQQDAQEYYSKLDGLSDKYYLEDCLTQAANLEWIEDVACARCTLLSGEAQLKKLISAPIHEKALEAVKKRLEQVESALTQDHLDDATVIKKCGITTNVWTKSTKTKQDVIGRPPKCLAIHVNRSTFNAHTFRTTKNGAHVFFPMDLDLGPWCLGTQSLEKGQEPEKIEHWEMDPRKSMLTALEDYDPDVAHLVPYRLKSIVTHWGHHDGGHYVCFRRYKLAPAPVFEEDEDKAGRDKGKEKETEEWWRISDDNVYSVPEGGVLGQSGQVVMLFYERIDVSHPSAEVDVEKVDSEQVPGSADEAPKSGYTWSFTTPGSSPTNISPGERGNLEDDAIGNDETVARSSEDSKESDDESTMRIADPDDDESAKLRAEHQGDEQESVDSMSIGLARL